MQICSKKFRAERERVILRVCETIKKFSWELYFPEFIINLISSSFSQPNKQPRYYYIHQQHQYPCVFCLNISQFLACLLNTIWNMMVLHEKVSIYPNCRKIDWMLNVARVNMAYLWIMKNVINIKELFFMARRVKWRVGNFMTGKSGSSNVRWVQRQYAH